MITKKNHVNYINPAAMHAIASTAAADLTFAQAVCLYREAAMWSINLLFSSSG